MAPKRKSSWADSRYQDCQFPGIFEQWQRTFSLIRLRGNGILYEEPKRKPKGSRGAARKHGKSFKLNGTHRAADREETFQLGEQTVRVQAWRKLHFKKLATLIGTLIQVEFLKAGGMPRYKRPMWLWWTGPQNVALSDLGRMYLWRFAIEHLFRFLKEPMGLNSNRSPNLVSAQQWIWLYALAHWQLLLMRDQVKPNRPAWDPSKANRCTMLTPYQPQRSALAFFGLELGPPAVSP